MDSDSQKAQPEAEIKRDAETGKIMLSKKVEEISETIARAQEQSDSLMKELENVQLQQQHAVIDYKEQISDMACKLEAYQKREKENNSIVEILKIKLEQVIAEIEDRIAKLTSQLEAYQSREEENIPELHTWKEKSSIQEKESEALQIKHEQIIAEFEDRIAKLTSQLEGYQSREEENNSELNTWKEAEETRLEKKNQEIIQANLRAQEAEDTIKTLQKRIAKCYDLSLTT